MGVWEIADQVPEWSAKRKLSGIDGGFGPVKFGISPAIGRSLLARYRELAGFAKRSQTISR
jgi:hypothetical protein